jgi:hypothetical protein
MLPCHARAAASTRGHAAWGIRDQCMDHRSRADVGVHVRQPESVRSNTSCISRFANLRAGRGETCVVMCRAGYRSIVSTGPVPAASSRSDPSAPSASQRQARQRNAAAQPTSSSSGEATPQSAETTA